MSDSFDPVDCNLLGFSIRGILQARILEWVAISFSRGSSRPRDQTQVSHIAGRRFNLRATREALAEASRFKKVKKTIAQKKQGSQDLNSELLNPNCMSAPLSQAIPLSSQFSCGPSNWMLDDLIIDQDGDSRSRDTPCVQGPTLGPSSSQG